MNCISTLLPFPKNRENTETSFEVYNDSYSNYNSLRIKAGWPTTEVSRMQKLAIEVFKTLNTLNPGFWKDSHSARRENDVINKGKNYNVRWKEPKDTEYVLVENSYAMSAKRKTNLTKQSCFHLSLNLDVCSSTKVSFFSFFLGLRFDPKNCYRTMYDFPF